MDVQPFWHNPPRLAGTSSRGTTRNGTRPPSAAPYPSDIPHCNAQYGQCVGVSVMGPSVCGRRFAPASRT
ncbi:hypothetical protein Acsp03_07220 [Actinomadura sp. NBRC 104412]|nr:hypothetical protein Acsp03_07220 [Actinomadura sp. NBRC 104412]